MGETHSDFAAIDCFEGGWCRLVLQTRVRATRWFPEGHRTGNPKWEVYFGVKARASRGSAVAEAEVHPVAGTGVGHSTLSLLGILHSNQGPGVGNPSL